MRFARQLRFTCLFAAFAAVALHGDLESLLEPVDKPVEEKVTPAPRVTSTSQEEPELPALIDEKALCGQLALLMQARMGVEGKLRLRFLRAWRPLQPDTDQWHVEILDMPNTLTSSFLLRFRLEVDGEEVGTWRIPMRASLTREVYFAGKTLPSGSAVDEETLLIRQIDTLELHNPAVAATESIDGFELTHTVSRGRPLLWRDLKTIPLVRSGEVVEAVAEDGLLHISMKAVALEDGGQDEFIRVRNPQSNKDLEAQVIDEKKVRVHF